jgi:hypothetical protein
MACRPSVVRLVCELSKSAPLPFRRGQEPERGRSRPKRFGLGGAQHNGKSSSRSKLSAASDVRRKRQSANSRTTEKYCLNPSVKRRHSPQPECGVFLLGGLPAASMSGPPTPRGRIRRGVFKSVAELEDAIRRYIQNHNRQAKPFVRTKTAKQIRDTAINSTHSVHSLNESVHYISET